MKQGQLEDTERARLIWAELLACAEHCEGLTSRLMNVWRLMHTIDPRVDGFREPGDCLLRADDSLMIMRWCINMMGLSTEHGVAGNEFDVHRLYKAQEALGVQLDRVLFLFHTEP